MAEFIDDVSRELTEAGGTAVMEGRRKECLTVRNGHNWQELRTNVNPPAHYCTHCLLVSLSDAEFWPTKAAWVGSNEP